MANVTFLNHASFALEHRGSLVVTDPWFSGDVFAQGWSLLSPGEGESYLQGRKIDAIVYTHEHPDHFSPSFLKKYLMKHGRLPLVIYQETRDKKLKDFVTRLGGQCIEIGRDEEFTGLDGFRIRVCPWDKGDSAIQFVLADETGKDLLVILNLNDCEFADASELQSFINDSRLTKSPDVLFTQFSYASWQGTIADTPRRRAAAKRKLNDIATQNSVLRPKHIVPFASFIYFCHQENWCHNDALNTPDDCLSFFASSDIDNILFLAPGQTLAWGGGRFVDDLDKSAALDYWRSRYSSVLSAKEFDTTTEVSLNDLQHISRIYAKLNLKFLCKRPLVGIYNLFSLPSVNIYLTDLDYWVKFHPLLGIKAGVGPTIQSMRISSDALAFAMKYPYGWETVHVSARFDVSSYAYYHRVMRSFCLGIHRNFETTGGAMARRILASWCRRLRTG